MALNVILLLVFGIHVISQSVLSFSSPKPKPNTEVSSRKVWRRFPGHTVSFVDVTVLNGGHSSLENTDPANNEPDLFDYFDPRISPHLYPSGIPLVPSNSRATSDDADGIEAQEDPRRIINLDCPAESNVSMVGRIGILLIDHGSKRDHSNFHLEKIAKAYEQSSRCPPHFVVRVAHMEIAAPSIKEGMQDLVDAGVSRIVCHPYFLSPGKHATVDLPRLIGEARETIRRPDINVVITDPIGSSVDILVNAIGELVEDAVRDSFKTQETLGFFGDIKSLVEEQ